MFKLFAANGSQIKTYGCKSLSLDLGLRRPIRWIFVIADLLKKFDLLIDVKNNKLRDNLTNIAIDGKILQTSVIQIKTLSSIAVYHQLVMKFPDILDVSTIKSRTKKHETCNIE